MRIFWLDVARAFAIVAVIVCHSVENIMPMYPEGISQLSAPNEAFTFIGFTFGRLGVPVFLFLTGYLMLDRRYDDQACKKFWKTKWLRLLACVEIWIVIYNICLALLGMQPFSMRTLAKNMLFLDNVAMGHFWYMPMIVGLYLFIPFIANALHNINYKTLYFPLCVACALFLCLPIANSFSSVLGVFSERLADVQIQTTLFTGFSGGTYGCYVFLGYLVKKGAFDKIAVRIWAIGLFALFAIVVGMQVVVYALGEGYNVWYDNGLLAMCGLCLFMLFSKIRQQENEHRVFAFYVESLSKYSFAIYLIHFPLLKLLVQLTPGYALALPMSVRVILLFVITLIASWAASAVLARIPFFGKYALYMR